MRASYPTIEISGDTIGKGRHVKVGTNSQQQTHVGKTGYMREKRKWNNFKVLLT